MYLIHMPMLAANIPEREAPIVILLRAREPVSIHESKTPSCPPLHVRESGGVPFGLSEVSEPETYQSFKFKKQVKPVETETHQSFRVTRSLQ